MAFDVAAAGRRRAMASGGMTNPGGLNSDKCFVEGQQIAPTLDTYHSYNTTRLDVEGTKKLLLIRGGK